MTRIGNTFFLCLLAATVSLRGSAWAAPSPIGGESRDFAAYLFVHFTGESPLGEQIYFAVKENLQ